MSEEINQPKRTLKTALDRKFGVSEVQDRERRGRRDDDARGGRKPFRARGESDQRDDRRPRDREDRPSREGREDRPWNRDRRPRRFGDRRGGDRPFNRRGKDADRGAAPVYRQRPEQKEAVFDENLDEKALEARSAQVEAIEDPVSNPPWFKKLIALTTEKGREREGHFLGEGVHVVDELVSHHREIVIAVYVVEGFSDENLIEKINEAEVNLHVLTEEQMKRLSST
ncbi:MAG: RNA methyltransferase, partial [Fibrobacter sp.]|nr:RNA methyltransferase [Fibrobacter sp.]